MINVYFVLLPDSLILDWAGPAEALRMANQALMAHGRSSMFRLHFVGPTQAVSTSVGVVLTQLSALPMLSSVATGQPVVATAGAPVACSPTLPCWVVLVGQAGPTLAVDSDASRATLHWLRGLRLSSGTLELVTICAGAVLAAHAGLLSNRRATTHHQHLDELKAVEPRCDVVANRVFVEDAPIYSSAGVTTGVDLVLHRIGAVCGPAIAAQVAQTMVVALRRGPGDPELSPFLGYRNHMHPALHRVQDAVGQSPQTFWSVPAMAQVAHTSPRHLTRLFLEHAQIAPLEYLRRIRLAVAQTALKSGQSVSQAAQLAGFSSDTQLRRAWHHFSQTGTPSGLHTKPRTEALRAAPGFA